MFFLFVLFALHQLFSDIFFEDPRLVEQVGLSQTRSAEERDMASGWEKHKFAVETFAKLLELVTLRHRLLESASETAHLAQLRQSRAGETATQFYWGLFVLRHTE